MLFSKSFGYAVRGLLYLSMPQNVERRVQLDEIAGKLNVPRFFTGKVMKRLVKNGVLNSVKGHNGGFYINANTKPLTLLQLVEIMGEDQQLSSCVLGLRACNENNPCPFHHRIISVRDDWKRKLNETTIADLLKSENPDFLQSLIVK